jgi:hypothetical protein
MTKNFFKLNPEWIIKEPIDFEYNKYTLLNYIQKCEKSLNNLEIYPDFVELSLHLANVHSLFKENSIFVTEKKFNSFDDEILLKDLIPKKFKNLSSEEEVEMSKTIKFSGEKLFEAFNIAKSIWTIAYDSIEINPVNNENKLSSKNGYVFLYEKYDDIFYLWKYSIRNIKNSGEKITIKLLKKINKIKPKKIMDLVGEDNVKKYPIFECTVNKKLPLDQTILPMIKRKINIFYNQSKKIKK